MINKHLEITQSIISLFMQKHRNMNGGISISELDFSQRYLGEHKFERSTAKIKLNCIGHFDWLDLVNNVNAQIVIFPMFFDLLDSYVDVRYGTVNDKFSKKIDKIKNTNNDDSDIFLISLYEFCYKLRNKMIHHKISYLQEQLEYAGNTVDFSSFQIINEMIYQYVLFNTGNSLYERNKLYSALYFLLEKNNEENKNCQFTQYLDKRLNPFTFIQSKTYIYNTISHIDNINGVVFDYIKYYPVPLIKDLDKNEPSILIKDEYILAPGQTYLIKLDNERQYLIPSELIIKNPEFTFNDIEDWRYPRVEL